MLTLLRLPYSTGLGAKRMGSPIFPSALGHTPFFSTATGQNHTLQDVSSKSYDRWTYIPEKQAAVEMWSALVTSLLRRPRRMVAV
jgi:hypothetical protein